MDQDMFKSNWNKIKGSMKKAWGELTDDDLLRIEGDYDKAVGTVQEKYSLAKEDARNKVDKFLKEMKN